MREFIYYKKDNRIAVSQYLPSKLETVVHDTKVTITQTQTDLGGSCNTINDTALQGTQRPDFWSIDFKINSDSPVRFSLDFRIPRWIADQPECILNGEKIALVRENKKGRLIL